MHKPNPCCSQTTQGCTSFCGAREAYDRKGQEFKKVNEYPRMLAEVQEKPQAHAFKFDPVSHNPSHLIDCAVMVQSRRRAAFNGTAKKRGC